MQSLNFPKYNFRLKKKEDVTFIFDVTRTKWLQLTPEEWIRQHWIHFLIDEIKAPIPLIATEIETKINTRKKRSDILVYKDNVVKIIVECKRSNVTINQKTLDQILVYNKSYFAKYLVLSNGISHKIFEVNYEKNSISELNSLPPYKNL